MSKKLHLLTFLLVVMLFFVGLLIGYIIWGLSDDNNSVDGEPKQNIQKAAVGQEDMHSHEKYEVPVDVPKPEITEVVVMKDAKMGWNVQLKTKNFIFSPENVNEANIDGQGHAHLYIDGQKITRLYSPYYYLSGYQEGVHKLKVTLNTNDHKDYTVDGRIIEASSSIVGEHDHTNEPDNHGH